MNKVQRAIICLGLVALACSVIFVPIRIDSAEGGTYGFSGYMPITQMVGGSQLQYYYIVDIFFPLLWIEIAVIVLFTIGPTALFRK